RSMGVVPVKYWFFLFLLVVVLGSCTFWPTEGTLDLEVVDDLGRMVPGAEVGILAASGSRELVFSGRTASDGRLQCVLPVGLFQIHVDDGVFQQEAQLHVRGRKATLRVVLHSPITGAIGKILRWDRGKLQSFLAMDPGVFVAELLFEGAPANPNPAFLEIPGFSADDGLKQAFLVQQLLPEPADPWLFEVNEEFQLRAFRTRDASGNIIAEEGVFASIGEPPSEDSRVLIDLSAMRNIGDLCHSLSLSAGQDGKVDVWDLIFLLNRYQTSDASADIGRMADTVVVPPRGPYAVSVHPDSFVDVGDLILLLYGYGSTLASVNTPFSPVISSVTFHSPPSSYQVNWTLPFSGDVQEQFTLYELDATPSFSTSTNVIGVFPKGTVSAVVPLSKAFVGICAVNTSPVVALYSVPAFYPTPLLPNPEISFQNASLSIATGSVFTVNVLASSLATFQSSRLVLHFSGGVSLQNVAVGSVFHTQGRVIRLSQGGGVEIVDTTHLSGQSSVLQNGVLLTLTCRALSGGSVHLGSAEMVDDALTTRTPSLGPDLLVSVY
ncbi:MAG TPA: hypothetical protein P5560_12875, partial [Thermotogota bacterium]|nr:hypothetical protein [Thermotogota bacterium]